MNPEIARMYGNKVRVRVCGLCWQEDAILMVKHKMGDNDFWAPPGGGVDFGEPLEEALKRELLEETGLRVTPVKFLFGCEFINKPLHAIELFFEVVKLSGILKHGTDPELPLIEKVQFMLPAEIQNIAAQHRHGIFNRFENANILRELRGFYRI